MIMKFIKKFILNDNRGDAGLSNFYINVVFTFYYYSIYPSYYLSKNFNFYLRFDLFFGVEYYLKSDYFTEWDSTVIPYERKKIS